MDVTPKALFTAIGSLSLAVVELCWLHQCYPLMSICNCKGKEVWKLPILQLNLILGELTWSTITDLTYLVVDVLHKYILSIYFQFMKCLVFVLSHVQCGLHLISHSLWSTSRWISRIYKFSNSDLVPISIIAMHPSIANPQSMPFWSAAALVLMTAHLGWDFPSCHLWRPSARSCLSFGWVCAAWSHWPSSSRALFQ